MADVEQSKSHFFTFGLYTEQSVSHYFSTTWVEKSVSHYFEAGRWAEQEISHFFKTFDPTTRDMLQQADF